MAGSQPGQDSTLRGRATAISRQSLFVFSGKISRQVLGFVIGLLIAKALGSSALGDYQLGVVVVHVLAMLAIMGADRGLVRFLPILSRASEGQAKRTIAVSFGLALSASTLLAVLLHGFGPRLGVLLFESESTGMALRAFAFYLPVFTLLRMLVAVFDGYKHADIESAVENVLIPLAHVVLLVCVSLLFPRLTFAIAARVLAYGMGCVILIRLAFRYFEPTRRAQAQGADLRAFYRYSAPLFLIGTLDLFMNHVDILLCGYYLDSSRVGIYAIAQRLALLSLLSLQAINVIFSPHVSELFHEQKLDQLERLFKLFTRWIFSFSSLVFVFYVMFGEQLLAFFGPEFTAGTSALLILTLGQMINGLGGPNGTILIMTGKQKWMLFDSVLMLASNAVLNVLLIPRLGIVGAALATGISLVVVNLLKTAQVYHEFRIHPYSWDYLGNAAVVVLSALGVVGSRLVWSGDGLLGAMAGGLLLLVLFVGFYLLLGRSQEDKMAMRLIKRRLERGGDTA
jgi:O-antigen/teichoic acid export membrane protein